MNATSLRSDQLHRRRQGHQSNLQAGLVSGQHLHLFWQSSHTEAVQVTGPQKCTVNRRTMQSGVLPQENGSRCGASAPHAENAFRFSVCDVNGMAYHGLSISGLHRQGTTGQYVSLPLLEILTFRFSLEAPAPTPLPQSQCQAFAFSFRFLFLAAHPYNIEIGGGGRGP